MSLSRAEWELLCQKVFERDLRQAWLRSDERELLRLSLDRFRQLYPERACVARFLDPSESGSCSGRLTWDHVKDRPMIGAPIQKRHTKDRKAPDDEWHLQTVCEEHHGLRIFSGDGWAGSQRGRELSRAYLASLYPAEP
jgi:hypothetical protein